MESWKKAKKGPHALLPFNTVPFTYRNAAAEATEIPEKRSIGHLSRPTKPKISRLITRRLIECRSSRGRASPLSISYARRGGERERERGRAVLFASSALIHIHASVIVCRSGQPLADVLYRASSSSSSRTGFSLGYFVYTRGPLASNFRQRLFAVREREGGRRVSRTKPAFESRFFSTIVERRLSNVVVG